MARYKRVDYSQGQFIPVQFERQILPGTFEHALNYVVDKKLSMSAFDEKRSNDGRGASAYDPRVMLKIVLFCYSNGIISSREIEAACSQNVVLMALSGNTRPHFTTIAQFVSDMGPAAQKLFVDVLLYCDELGLIGREMFAVDGCKISSNASKEWSGTRGDFEKRREKFEETISRLLRRHLDIDAGRETEVVPGARKREEKAIAALEAKVAKIDEWLRENPEDRKGTRGQPIKSSMTDPDSAKLVSSHGVLQGYNGLAMVDAKHQVIVGAEAFGKGGEAELLEPMVQQVKENFEALGEKNVYEKAKVLADSGFHAEDSVKMLAERSIDGYVPDRMFRKRDPLFLTAPRHRSFKALPGRERHKRKYFTAAEFVLDPEKGKLICPAGKELYVKDSNFRTKNGYHGVAYMAKKGDCSVCELRPRCLRNPATSARHVAKLKGRDDQQSFSKKMIEKIDTAAGRFLYSLRMGIVEPVFANIRHTMSLNRFTLRGHRKVTAQWRLYAVIHNIHKVQRFACAGAG